MGEAMNDTTSTSPKGQTLARLRSLNLPFQQDIDKLKAAVSILSEYFDNVDKDIADTLDELLEDIDKAPAPDPDGWIPFERNSGRPEGVWDHDNVDIRCSNGQEGKGHQAFSLDRQGWHLDWSDGVYITHWRRTP